MNQAIRRGVCLVAVALYLFGCGNSRTNEETYSCKMKSTTTWQDGTVQYPYGEEGYAYEFSINNTSNTLVIPGMMKGDRQTVKGKRIGNKVEFQQPSAATGSVQYVFNVADLVLTASTRGDSGSDGTFSILDKGTCIKQ